MKNIPKQTTKLIKDYGKSWFVVVKFTQLGGEL
jgi:hypothetical protein